MGLALLISQLLGNLGLALLLPLTGPTQGLPAIILLQTVSALLLPGCSTARQAQPARHWGRAGCWPTICCSACPAAG
jgi:hypothetical protein